MIITKVSKNNKIDFSQIKPGQFFINHFSGHLWMKTNAESWFDKKVPEKELPQAVCLEDGMLGYFAASALVQITVLEANEV